MNTAKINEFDFDKHIDYINHIAKEESSQSQKTIDNPIYADIDSNGYLCSIFTGPAVNKVKIDKITAEKFHDCPFGYAWQFKNNEGSLQPLISIDYLRVKRQIDCFNILDNRSQLGWNNLTEEQKAELDTWYKAGLVVTDTKVIPEKPDGLK